MSRLMWSKCLGCLHCTSFHKLSITTSFRTKTGERCPGKLTSFLNEMAKIEAGPTDKTRHVSNDTVMLSKFKTDFKVQALFYQVYCI